jgi:hypothetical protein
MRFLSFESHGHAKLGWIKDATSTAFVDLSLLGLSLPTDLKSLIETPGAMAAAHAAAQQAPASAMVALASVHLLPLIPNPGKIVCMGLNYADHAKEGGNARPDYPSFFLRGATSMVGHWHGGLGLAGVLACALFAAVSGSSPATVVAIGSILLPAMVKAGFPKRFGAGVITTSGALGILIPPSLILVIYSLVAEEPIAKLFAAAMIPGIVLAIAYVVVIAILAKLHPEKMPLRRR